VGTDVNAPVCSIDIANPNLALDTPNLYVDYLILNPPTCLGSYPPTVGQPWWLEARDTAQIDAGSIQDFEVLLPGGERCLAAPLPVPIPDAIDPGDGPFVYTKVDCTIKVTPPDSTPTPTPSPTPIPGPNAFGNVDCGGTISSVDALKLLRYNAALSYSQTEPCTDIGVALPNGEFQGDVNCSNLVNSVDALLVLRYVAGLSVGQVEPCPDVGS
jgi:hypothetical protein